MSRTSFREKRASRGLNLAVVGCDCETAWTTARVSRLLVPGLALLAVLSGCDRAAGVEEGARSATGPADSPDPPGAQATGGATMSMPEPVRPARLVRRPTSPDPLGGAYPLDRALRGVEGEGTLRAEIRTTVGVLRCTLDAQHTPITVANFVGLARGERPFWDPRSAAWERRPLFDGTTFHRVFPGFMIQGGCHVGDGTGDVGYTIPDELRPGASHDRAGLLCMANKGPNTNGGQFFILDAAAPHLTAMKTYTIFGACEPTEVVHRIARSPRPHPRSDRPTSPAVIEQVRVFRSPE